MMLGRFAAAAIFLAATMSGLCAAADQRFLVLDGSWVKWGAPNWGAGASVTFAFAASPVRSPSARNCAVLLPFDELAKRTGLPGQRLRDEAEAAFAAWAKVSGVTFVETQAADRADIVIGVEGNPMGRAFTNVELESSPIAEAAPATERGLTAILEPRSLQGQPHGIRSIRKALICLNPQQKWKIGFNGNLNVYDVRYTLMHEIGHAIGLDHPGAAGALMGFRYDEKLNGPAKGDSEAVQRLYGTQTAK
jgi:hypothetical protein